MINKFGREQLLTLFNEISIPLGMAYAIWSGVGLVLTAIVGVLVFGEKVDFWGILSIGLILAGVVLMNTLSKMGGH